MRDRWAWVVATACVVAAWAFGHGAVHAANAHKSYGTTELSPLWDAGLFLAALPAALAAGVLARGTSRTTRLASLAFVALAAAVLVLLTFFLSLELCEDPGEACRRPSAAVAAHLGAPLAVIAAGYAVARGRVLP